MVTWPRYHGYRTSLPWLHDLVTMSTGHRYHGYRTSLPWLQDLVTMVTGHRYHSYRTLLPWLQDIVTFVPWLQDIITMVTGPRYHIYRTSLPWLQDIVRTSLVKSEMLNTSLSQITSFYYPPRSTTTSMSIYTGKISQILKYSYQRKLCFYFG